MLGKFVTKPPTRNDWGLALDHLDGGYPLYVMVRKNRVRVVTISPEAVIVEFRDCCGELRQEAIPKKRIRFTVEIQRKLRFD
jgi:hypothetical protein